MPRHTALLLALSFTLGSCPEPDFVNDAQSASPDIMRITLPVFRTPSIDDDNPIQAVFVDNSNPAAPHLRIIWADEDFPIKGVDEIYDANRWWGIFQVDTVAPYIWLDLAWDGYHRIADVEGLDYEVIPNPTGAMYPHTVHFPGTYSEDQRFKVLVAEHYTATVAGTAFETTPDGRPIIYVNTWNHMMSQTDNNPNMPKTDWSDYPVYSGSSGQLQGFYESVWTDFGLDL
ncbi:MAG: hypothetical protein HOM34_03270 [Planctomycetes bacterium]|jgi:hypothetical protein|nr:hypothetical protein [Planctomycetota bacterium]MBT4029205.1 hypothetical protein [Planctomycetota bacterium]MBT4559286.1 hypothetical protein [Planctomycetota bacterium]MBT5102004.1 hypothetical protein [Planctomycetota bacterium]MBT5119727.1 hypothetical protein [Planctomycetota bacterium]